MSEKNDFPQRQISGWSNTNVSRSTIIAPETAGQIPQIIGEAVQNKQTVLSRGAGQSYGDQSLNAENVLIDMSRLNRILNWDTETGLLRIESGATYSQILNRCLKDNWTLPVIPGTRYVTMGGALANNVHGKNSPTRGNFGEWVREFKIVLASGQSIICSRENNSELFRSAIGGAGLLGVVTEMTLQLVRIPSPYLSVQKNTASGLSELMDALDKTASGHEFSITQVDCFPSKKGLGRGTLHSADFCQAGPAGSDVEKMSKIGKTMFGFAPKKWILALGKYFLNNFTMRLISATKYQFEKNMPQKSHRQDIFEFIFFLDKMPGWKEVFKHGFFEYEPLIPKNKGRETIARLIGLTHQYKMPAYLSAIKVHRKDDFLLSYSLDGYSFAMDIPRRPHQKENQEKLFREMNKVVMEAGGIIYLAKDATLTPAEFRQMYPVDKFMELKKKYDPSEIFQSDMYRRIFKK